MEPGSSLPRLQGPAIYPYSEPDQSRPCTPIPFPKDPYQYYPHNYAVQCHKIHNKFRINRSNIKKKLKWDRCVCANKGLGDFI